VPIMKPLVPDRGPQHQAAVPVEPTTVARQPAALPPVKAVAAGSTAAVVLARPVASLSTLVSEMSQIPTESISSVAVANERTVKRVFNKGAKKQNTSP
jgi:hypothetical protein